MILSIVISEVSGQDAFCVQYIELSLPRGNQALISPKCNGYRIQNGKDERIQWILQLI